MDDEMEMTRAELQIFIHDHVNRRELRSEELMRKFYTLQTLLGQKDKLCTDLFKLFESVSKCEVIVRQLYSKLGWVYEEIVFQDDGSDDNASNSGATYDESDVCSASPVSNDRTDDDSNEEQTEVKKEWPETLEERLQVTKPRRELRVLLDRLPIEPKLYRTIAINPSKRPISDDELSSVDSDYLPQGESSDSDFSLTSSKSGRPKKKKLKKIEKVIKVDAKDVPVSQATEVQPATSIQPAIRANTSDKSGKPEVKPETRPFAVNDTRKPPKALPLVPEDLQVGMRVWAKRKVMRWESGQVAEIFEKEDGTKKFKVTFEDKGKVLVSGHHIAYEAMPKLVHLAVGSRVVSKYKSENTFYSPGILGELPSRKNHMRFLIFFDDQKTLYVALPVIRLVFKPLADPLDDLRHEEHKSFMKEYLQRMPYPPHTQFRVGQQIQVVRDEVFETCTVLLLDCSLMEVEYAKDNEKEWIYRGSIRLEHLSSLKDQSD